MDDLSRLLQNLERVAESSSQLTTLALSVVAASLAAIVGTSYVRPPRCALRLPYLLFVPGWVLIALSILRADELIGGSLAAVFGSPIRVPEIAAKINSLYAEQRGFFRASLGFFGGWLLVYLSCWIFVDGFVPEKSE